VVFPTPPFSFTTAAMIAAISILLVLFGNRLCASNIHARQGCAKHMTINSAHFSRLDHGQIGHARLVDTCLGH